MYFLSSSLTIFLEPLRLASVRNDSLSSQKENHSLSRLSNDNNENAHTKRHADMKQQKEPKETRQCLLLPRRLLRWAREHWYGGNLVETATDRRLVVLPPHARVVVDKVALAERVGDASSLRHERLLLLLLRRLDRHRAATRKRVRACRLCLQRRGSGLERRRCALRACEWVRRLLLLRLLETIATERRTRGLGHHRLAERIGAGGLRLQRGRLLELLLLLRHSLEASLLRCKTSGLRLHEWHLLLLLHSTEVLHLSHLLLRHTERVTSCKSCLLRHHHPLLRLLEDHRQALSNNARCNGLLSLGLDLKSGGLLSFNRIEKVN